MDARALVAKLGGRWRGGYGIAPCPAHDDHDPSLSVRDGKGGRILWHCHTGCSQDTVLKALRDGGLLKHEAKTPRSHKSRRRIEATYDYHGANSLLLFQVLRYSPKGFSQRRPDGKGGWIWNLKGIEPVLYRLPYLLQAGADTIFIVEGEKDADGLAKLGLTATCNPGGAGKWQKHYNPYFRDKRVVILPDNDSPGREHAQVIAASLDGIADQIKVVELTDLKAKGDISDWVAAGGTRAELLWICDAVRVWERDAGDWYAEAMTGARGQVLCNHANAMHALRRDPAWRRVFGYDEMRSQVMLLRPVPIFGQPPEPAMPAPIPWADENDTQAQEYLQLVGFPHMGSDTVSKAISQRAMELKYHPVADHINSLKWDGIPRIQGGPSNEGDTVESFFVEYFGAEDTQFVRAVGTMFLVSAVARIMEPGCKADHIVILEGRQGIGKSTSFRILAGEHHFSDALPEIGTKDAADHLRGKWIIEIAELDAMTRAENAAAKAFITRQVDKYRPSYGRREIETKRRCVFVGTTNSSAYLKDETGGRRYWPIQCESIDLEALERDRDQIWAEAVQLYREGKLWHITDPALLDEAAMEQRARYDTDVWEDKIADYIVEKTEVSISEVMESALGIDTQNWKRADQNRVMKILSHIGWKRGHRMSNGRRAWAPESPSD